MKLNLTLIFVFFVAISYGQMVKPVVLISGKAVNERNMQAVEARVIYEVLPEGTQAGVARTNPSTGDYKIVLPYGKKYGYMALAEGYYSVTQYLDVTKLDKYTEIEEQNLFLAPVEVDQVVRLNNIFFEGRSAKITSESFPELLRLVLFLKVNKKIEIEISGHTDNQGNPVQNLKLSKDRAQAVADYIINNGIKDTRLTVNGFGDTNPIGFNSTEEGRKMNERIEFKVLSLEKSK
ncbi:MAG TPA: hypothetical protein DDX39_07880 [Bacteroidales bacterium]|nr:MAG: hypothetical protein A2W98_02385 [Bacteroidetes bacterium GWF2_33_38]OFY76626.1 MAG: hypothetical protein A2265_07180 [Bacteroidetes bacterium RIFOXYA12_FULL_33_9]OFY92385.1 MAG: hypothetical protein A2236_01885 [Bacteroidetes bacterium RIFOXYA2_FULL_33_7]HBF88545.1 hypothetical protein [Bacteroidales bacterium]